MLGLAGASTPTGAVALRPRWVYPYLLRGVTVTGDWARITCGAPTSPTSGCCSLGFVCWAASGEDNPPGGRGVVALQDPRNAALLGCLEKALWGRVALSVTRVKVPRSPLQQPLAAPGAGVPPVLPA